MAKTTKQLLGEIDALSTKNAALMQQLNEAAVSAEPFKSGNIDALILSHEQGLSIYSKKTSDKPYRILIEKMHEGAVTLNESGIIIYCNSYFAYLVNLPLQKVIGTKFINFIDHPAKMEIEALLEKGKVKAFKKEIYINDNKGRKIPVLMSVNALMLENVLVLSIIITDLTIQKENEEKLKLRSEELEVQNEKLERTNNELVFQIEEKEKRGMELSIAKTDVKELEVLNTHIKNVLATLSHDLRSPLASIIGMAEMLNTDYETLDLDTIKTMLNLLYKASTNELRMLDYLLEWARIKYASDAFSPVEIFLARSVKNVFETLNKNAVSKNLQLYNEIEENIRVFADDRMLLSILQNLVSNSIQHSYVGGKIIISAKTNEDKIVVEINDNGIGMSPKIKEILFTPQIVTLTNARKANKGAGIGLLLVKGFLEKNGGKIWVESNVGEGSSFYFTLPVPKSLENTDYSDKTRLYESV